MSDDPAPSASELPPQPSSPVPAGGPDDDDTGYEDARQAVGAVIAWYSQQLLLARRAGDQQRLDELKTRRQECLDDQHRLRDAERDEIARIATAYAERLRHLEASG